MDRKATCTWNAAQTKAGFVSLWEEGGSCTNTGSAVLIAKPSGEKPTAVYIPRRGHLCNGKHALIPVHEGYLVIKSYHHRGDFTHFIYMVVETISGENPSVKVDFLNEYCAGGWYTEPSSAQKLLVKAAERKVTTYHCREAQYAEFKKK